MTKYDETLGMVEVYGGCSIVYENTAYLYGGVNAKNQISAFLPCKHEVRRIGYGSHFLTIKK